VIALLGQRDVERGGCGEVAFHPTELITCVGNPVSRHHTVLTVEPTRSTRSLLTRRSHRPRRSLFTRRASRSSGTRLSVLSVLSISTRRSTLLTPLLYEDGMVTIAFTASEGGSGEYNKQ
jgi:hypothetical protein